MNEYALAGGIALFAIGFGLTKGKQLLAQWKQAIADGEISLDEGHSKASKPSELERLILSLIHI